MRQLNHTYRQQDKVTNVLSFPADLPAIAPAATQTGDESLPGFDYQLLGDIVVCAAVLSEEAAAQGKRVADHWAHMLVHGTLHLLGYDHLGESDAARMEAQEVEILRSYGIADPYWVD
jgi:probable rRNA maturation factor